MIDDGQIIEWDSIHTDNQKKDLHGSDDCSSEDVSMEDLTEDR